MKRATVRALIPVLALLLPACDSATGPGEPAPATITELPRSLSETEVEAIAASNGFAFRLLEAVRAGEEPGENLFLSPLSVSMALGMAANGARGETLEAMHETLGVGHLTRAEMNEAYRGLLDLLPGLDPQVTLGIANSAWLLEGFPFRTSFVDRIETSFDAEARELDFSAPGARDVVNGWVAEKTEGRIEEILEEIWLDPPGQTSTTSHPTPGPLSAV